MTNFRPHTALPPLHLRLPDSDPAPARACSSAKNVTPQHIIREFEYTEVVRACIVAAFPGSSPWDIAGNAVLGGLHGDRFTIYRVLTEKTSRIDGGIASRAYIYGGHKVKDPRIAAMLQAVAASFAMAGERH
jgi:hypothetical protein